MTHHNDCHRQFHFSFVYSHYLKGGGNDLCFSIQRRKRYRKPGYRTLCAGTFKLFCSAFFSSRRRRRRRRLFTSTPTPLLPNPPSHLLASPPPHPLAPRLSLGVAVRVHPIFFRSFFLFLFFFFSFFSFHLDKFCSAATYRVLTCVQLPPSGTADCGDFMHGIVQVFSASLR